MDAAAPRAVDRSAGAAAGRVRRGDGSEHRAGAAARHHAAAARNGESGRGGATRVRGATGRAGGAAAGARAAGAQRAHSHGRARHQRAGALPLPQLLRRTRSGTGRAPALPRGARGPAPPRSRRDRAHAGRDRVRLRRIAAAGSGRMAVPAPRAGGMVGGTHPRISGGAGERRGDDAALAARGRTGCVARRGHIRDSPPGASWRRHIPRARSCAPEVGGGARNQSAKTSP